MKLSPLKKKLLLVLYQCCKAGVVSFYGVSDLADVIWEDKAFYRSERTGQPLVKKSVSVSLSRSLKRLKKDGLVVEDREPCLGENYVRYCLTPKGVSKARNLESDVMDWVSLIERGSQPFEGLKSTV